MPIFAKDFPLTQTVKFNHRLAKSIIDAQGYLPVCHTFRLGGRDDALFLCLIDYLNEQDKLLDLLRFLADNQADDIIEFCLKTFKGWPLEQQINETGDTLLHHLVLSGNVTALSLINQYESLPLRANAEGDTFVDVALKEALTSVFPFLFEQELLKPEDVNRCFYLACQKGDLKTVEWLYHNQDVDINAKDEATGNSPCHIACQEVHTNIVDFLLAHGTDRTIQNKDSMTAIELAASEKKWASVQCFCQEAYQEDSEHQSHYDVAFVTACYNKRFDIALALIPLNIKYDTSIRQSKNTGLHYAVIHQHHDTIEAILSQTENIWATDKKNKTALDKALELGDIKALTLFVTHATLSEERLIKVLFKATELNNLELIKRVLEKHGSLINKVNSETGDTILHMASRLGFSDIVSFLLATGADRTIKNKKMRAPIESATYQYHWQTVAAYCKTEYKEDEKHASLYDSALLSACNEDRFDIAQKLIPMNLAYTWHYENTGHYALHIVVDKQHYETLEAMLMAGANTNKRNKANKTALDIALDKKDIIAIKLFIQHGQLSKDILFNLYIKALEFNDLSLVQSLIEHDKKILKQVDSDKNTPLHLACAKGHSDIVAYLLQQGANRSSLNKDDQTPIRSASKEEQWDCVLAFCQESYKEDEEHTSQYGAALEAACHSKRFDVALKMIPCNPSFSWRRNETLLFSLHHAVIAKHYETIEALLQAGHTTSYVNKGGETALDIAMKNKDLQAITIFVQHGNLSKDLLFSVLVKAIELGALPLVKKIVETHQSVIKKKDKDGNTALHLAGIQGHRDIVTTLLAQGASRVVQNNNNSTPIRAAALKDQWDCVLAYCHRDYREDAEHSCQYGAALENACFEKRFDIALKLIPLNPSFTWHRCDTLLYSLHHAVIEKHHETLAALLKAGAPIKNKSKAGETALDIAIKNDDIESLVLFVEHGSLDKNNLFKILIKATELDNIQLVRRVIEKNNAVISMKNADKDTALHIAAKKGFKNIVEYLLKQGADRTIKNKANITPIAEASTNNKWDCVEAFCLPEYREGSGQHASNYGFALVLACKNKQYYLASKILSCDAATTWFDKESDNRSIHFATMDKQYDLLKALLIAGGYIKDKNKKNKTAIDIAIENDDMKALLIYVEHGQLDKTELAQILFRAVKLNQLELVTNIIKKDKSIINNQDKDENTPLHIAAQNGHRDIVTLLLQSGARTDIRNKKGSYAASSAAKGQSWDCIEAFITECEVSIEQSTQGDGQALISVCKHKQYDLAMSILKRKPAVDAFMDQKTNNQPIHFAVIDKQYAMLRALLKLGSQFSRANKDSKTPIDIALEADDIEALSLFVDHAALPDTIASRILFKAAHLNQLALVQKIIKKYPAIIDKQNEDDCTVLHIAARQGYSDIVNFLLKQGANHTLLNKSNLHTAMASAADMKHWPCVEIFCDVLYQSQHLELSVDGHALVQAAKYEQFDLAIKLISRQTNVNGQDMAEGCKNSPLHYAVMHQHHRLIKGLLTAGASVSTINAAGKSALDIAIENRDSEALMLFVNSAKLDEDALYRLFLYAIENNHIDLATAILAKNQGLINRQTAVHQLSPLHFALGAQSKMVEFCLRHQVDITLKEAEGKTAIDLLLEKKDWATLELITKQYFVTCDSFQAVLFHAYGAKQKTLLAQLIKHRVALDYASPPTENTILHELVKAKELNLLSELLAPKDSEEAYYTYNSPINQQKETPFELAIKLELDEIIDIFVKTNSLSTKELESYFAYCVQHKKIESLGLAITRYSKEKTHQSSVYIILSTCAQSLTDDENIALLKQIKSLTISRKYQAKILYKLLSQDKVELSLAVLKIIKTTPEYWRGFTYDSSWHSIFTQASKLQDKIFLDELHLMLNNSTARETFFAGIYYTDELLKTAIQFEDYFILAQYKLYLKEKGYTPNISRMDRLVRDLPLGNEIIHKYKKYALPLSYILKKGVLNQQTELFIRQTRKALLLRATVNRNSGLINAVIHNQIHLAIRLLGLGIDPALQCATNQYSALELAVKNNQIEMVKHLVQFYRYNEQAYAPFDVDKHIQQAKKLVPECEAPQFMLEALNSHSEDYIDVAILSGQVDKMKTWLESEPEIDSARHHDILQLAIDTYQVDMLKPLIAYLKPQPDMIADLFEYARKLAPDYLKVIDPLKAELLALDELYQGQYATGAEPLSVAQSTFSSKVFERIQAISPSRQAELVLWLVKNAKVSAHFQSLFFGIGKGQLSQAQKSMVQVTLQNPSPALDKLRLLDHFYRYSKIYTSGYGNGPVKKAFTDAASEIIESLAHGTQEKIELYQFVAESETATYGYGPGQLSKTSLGVLQRIEEMHGEADIASTVPY